MGCFLVPATEAIVSSAVTKVVENNDKKEFVIKSLKRLNGMLWGGSALLAFEHLWHGEIQPFFPFLTAAANPADTAEMLGEISTVGVSMAVVVTAVWGVMTYVSYKLTHAEDKTAKLAK